jgi:hypothetical protein
LRGNDTPFGNILYESIRVLDDLADNVYTWTPVGAFVTICSTASFGANSPQGIAYVAGTDQFAIVD